jgi:DNA-binding response OmpR family regulator
MDILIVEDEILLGLLLADALADVGYRVLGPASCRAEALELLAAGAPHLAFVDIELKGGDSGIELAAELRCHAVPCVFATGQPDRARSHRELALGLVPKPYNPMTLVEVARYFETLHAGERPARLPRGLELFGPDPLPVSAGLLDPSAPAVMPFASADPAGPAASAGLPPQPDQRLAQGGVLEALTG